MITFILCFYYLFSLFFIVGRNLDKLNSWFSYIVIPLCCWFMLPMCLGAICKKIDAN